MPSGAIYVGMPSIFGNPFETAGEYREWLKSGAKGLIRRYGFDNSAARKRVLEGIPKLRGKSLACWCKPGYACHADVLLELANKKQVWKLREVHSYVKPNERKKREERENK